MKDRLSPGPGQHFLCNVGQVLLFPPGYSFLNATEKVCLFSFPKGIENRHLQALPHQFIAQSAHAHCALWCGSDQSLSTHLKIEWENGHMYGI